MALVRSHQIGRFLLIAPVVVMLSSRANADDVVAFRQIEHHVFRLSYGKSLQVDRAPLPGEPRSEKVLLSFRPMPPIPIDLTDKRVHSASIGNWLPDGIALTFTLHDETTHQFLYGWATLDGSRFDGSKWAVGMTALVHGDGETPYTSQSVDRDSLRGDDTIVAVWQRYLRESDGLRSLDRLTYVHKCPGGAAALASGDIDLGDFYIDVAKGRRVDPLQHVRRLRELKEKSKKP